MNFSLQTRECYMFPWTGRGHRLGDSGITKYKIYCWKSWFRSGAATSKLRLFGAPRTLNLVEAISASRIKISTSVSPVCAYHLLWFDDAYTVLVPSHFDPQQTRVHASRRNTWLQITTSTGCNNDHNTSGDADRGTCCPTGWCHIGWRASQRHRV